MDLLSDDGGNDTWYNHIYDSGIMITVLQSHYREVKNTTYKPRIISIMDWITGCCEYCFGLSDKKKSLMNVDIWRYFRLILLILHSKFSIEFVGNESSKRLLYLQKIELLLFQLSEEKKKKYYIIYKPSFL